MAFNTSYDVYGYLSKPVLGGNPVLSGHYSIPRGCPVNAGFTLFVCFSFSFLFFSVNSDFHYFIFIFPGYVTRIGERAGLTPYRLKMRGTFNISSLDKEQLANIHGHFWKERLKRKKPIKFKGDTQQKRAKISIHKVVKSYRRFRLAPNLLSPQNHLNSDWVQVCRRLSEKTVEGSIQSHPNFFLGYHASCAWAATAVSEHMAISQPLVWISPYKMVSASFLGRIAR